MRAKTNLPLHPISKEAKCTKNTAASPATATAANALTAAEPQPAIQEAHSSGYTSWTWFQIYCPKATKTAF